MSLQADQLPPARRTRVECIRARVYEVMEVGHGEDATSRVVDAFLISLILLNVVAFTLESVASLHARYETAFFAFEVFSITVFSIEYALRIWTAVEVPFLSRMAPWRARLNFASRPLLLIDLLAIAPFFLGLLFNLDLRAIRVLRLFRFLKLARYSPAMHTLLRVLGNERRALMGAVLLVFAALLLSATGMYYLEREAQPDKFGSIPEAAWWAMATLTTVGYGDLHPITPLGKLFGVFVMLLGIGVLALPIAILSTGFAQEVSRRDFVVTWTLMSRIPLFTELDAAQAAEFIHYLSAHNYPARWEVIHEGGTADGMFFIASGRVRVQTQAGESELGTGDFFGEVEMLRRSTHQYRYTTATNCRLLKMSRDDFDRLAATNPVIGAHVRAIAAARTAARDAGQPEPRGNFSPAVPGVPLRS